MPDLISDIRACRICADRFAATHSGHVPRPVLWVKPNARILIAGQAPGARVHASGQPFTDPSGDRLRQWMAMEAAEFYDKNMVAILPMAFCFPGYNARQADLPPPPICARTWRQPLISSLSNIRLTLLVGGYAQKWHLGRTDSVTDTVAQWRDHAPSVFPLPHPSWRNTAWLTKHRWFESELLPEMRKQIQKVIND